MVWCISKCFLFPSCCWKQDGIFPPVCFENLGKLLRWFLQYCESPLKFSSFWCLNLRLVHTEASAQLPFRFSYPRDSSYGDFCSCVSASAIMTPCICLSDFLVIGAVICLVFSPHLWIQEGLNFSVFSAFYMFWEQGGDFQTPICGTRNQKFIFLSCVIFMVTSIKKNNENCKVNKRNVLGAPKEDWGMNIYCKLKCLFLESSMITVETWCSYDRKIMK